MAHVQLLSDIHFECHADGGIDFVRSLNPSGVDVLALAGDIGMCKGGSLGRGIQLLTERYGDIPIVFVRGNHEYYKSTREEVDAYVDALKEKYPTFHPLENSTVELAGQRFVGCTLWFPELASNKLHEFRLGDFSQIKGFWDWNYQLCADSMQFLKDTVREGDFVITHHIPDARGIHPRYLRPGYRDLNVFFLCQMPPEVLEKPSYWAFGHTHDSMAFTLGDCRFRCNPFSYPREGNPHFNEKLILGGTRTILCPSCGKGSEWASDHTWIYGNEGSCPHCSDSLNLTGD